MHIQRWGECLKQLHFEFLNLLMKIMQSNTPKQWQRTFGCFVHNKDPPCVFGQSWCLVQQKRLTARGQLSLPLIKHTCGLALMYHLQMSWTFIHSASLFFKSPPQIWAPRQTVQAAWTWHCTAKRSAGWRESSKTSRKWFWDRSRYPDIACFGKPASTSSLWSSVEHPMKKKK